MLRHHQIAIPIESFSPGKKARILFAGDPFHSNILSLGISFIDLDRAYNSNGVLCYYGFNPYCITHRLLGTAVNIKGSQICLTSTISN